MEGLKYLLFFDAVVLVFWYWVVFRGGDETWCAQIKKSWKDGSYDSLTPARCRIFAWIVFVGVMFGSLLGFMSMLATAPR